MTHKGHVNGCITHNEHLPSCLACLGGAPHTAVCTVVLWLRQYAPRSATRPRPGQAVVDVQAHRHIKIDARRGHGRMLGRARALVHPALGAIPCRHAAAPGRSGVHGRGCITISIAGATARSASSVRLLQQPPVCIELLNIYKAAGVRSSMLALLCGLGLVSTPVSSS